MKRVFHMRDDGRSYLGAVLLLEFFKGSIPAVLLAYTGLPLALAAAVGIDDGASLVTPLLIWSAGFCAVLGHCFTPWLNFKGGKGVAVAFGVFAVMAPLAALIGVLGFGFCYLKTRNYSLCSLVAVSLSILSFIVMNTVQAHVFVGAALCFIVLIRHEESLDTLLEGPKT